MVLRPVMTTQSENKKLHSSCVRKVQVLKLKALLHTQTNYLYRVKEYFIFEPHFTLFNPLAQELFFFLNFSTPVYKM